MVFLLYPANTTGMADRAGDLSEVEPPEIPELKELHRRTPVVRNGKTNVVIVAPASGRYETQATTIRDTIADLTGVRVPVVADDAPEASVPPGHHTIVVGNRATNATLGALYDRYCTMIDAKYPGEGGYVVRTVHDPFGEGQNVVLAGGSDDAGVAWATEHLGEHLRKAGDGADGGTGSLTLGWLQDVQVSPNYDLPDVGEASAMVPHWDQSHGMGERNHTHFGWNALARNMALYFMTGDERYAEEFLRLRDPDEETRNQLREWDERGYQNIEDPLSNLHHYTNHKTILLWDLIEESPFFTDEQRLSVTRSFRKEYAHRIGEEFYGLTEPADDAGGRHPQFEALSQLVVARYFRTSYPDEFWEQAYAGAANKFKALYESPQLGGTECENAYFYPSYFQPSIDYMLLTGDRQPMRAGTMPEIFDGLEALHSDLDRHWSLATFALNHANKIAHLTGEGQWLTYRQNMAMDTDEFRVGQSFWPEATEPIRPNHLVGEWSINRMAHRYWERNFGEIAENEAFLWGSWRSRSDAGGDFVLLDGHDGGGRNHLHFLAVPELRIDGQTILQGDSWTNLAHMNQVRTYADGMVGPEVSTAAALKDRGHLGGTAFAVAEAEGVGCSDWRRILAQRVGQFAVFADVVTATQDTENFEIQTSWQGYDAVWDDREQVLELPDRGPDPSVGHVRFGDVAGVETNDGIARLTQRFAAEAGDRRINVSLVYPEVETPDEWSCLRVSPDTVVLETPEPTVVTVETDDADFSMRSDEHFFGLGVRRWTADGTVLFRADHPVAVDWDTVEGKLVVRANGPTRVTYRNDAGDLAETRIEGEETVTRAGLSDQHRTQVRESFESVVAEGKRARQQALTAEAESESGPMPADCALEPAWECDVDKPASIVEHVTIDGQSRWLVGSGETVHVFGADGEEVATLKADAAVCAVHYWAETSGEPLVVTGHMDQQVHAWHFDGERAWSYRTRMTEETLRTGQNQWFHDAWPGVHGLASHPDFHDGPTLFVGSACTLELLNPSGDPTWRTPIFWGLPRYFEAICESDGTTSMVVGNDPSSDMAAAVVNEAALDPTRTRFKSVPEGHTQVTNWGSIVRRHIFSADIDGDGKKEVVSDLTGYWDRVTIWRSDGTAVANAQFGPGEGRLQQGLSDHHALPDYRIRDMTVADEGTDGKSHVLVATRDGYLVSLTHDLDRRWSRYLGAPVDVVTTVPADGGYRSVVGTRDGSVRVLDPTGTVERHARMDGSILDSDTDDRVSMVGMGDEGGRFAVFSTR